MKPLLRCAILLLGIALLGGCAAEQNRSQPARASTLPNTAPSGSTLVWHAGIQFVALTPQPSDTPANHQPIHVTAAQLRSALAALQVSRGTATTGEPVFTAGALKALGPPLARALAKAGPHEDVTFAVLTRGDSGRAPMLIIHIQQPLITTGRAFYRHGHLNVIFGLMHAPFEDHYVKTGQLPALTPGQRSHRLHSGWRVVSDRPLTYPQPQRRDWVSVALAQPPAASKPAPQTAQSSPQPAPKTVESEYHNLATRLRVLDKLHQQGLITNQEFQQKRKQILNGL